MSLSLASRMALRAATGEPARLADDCPGPTVAALRRLGYAERDTRRLTGEGLAAKRRIETPPPPLALPRRQKGTRA